MLSDLERKGTTMELIDNISLLLGDDLKQTIRLGARLKIAASCFSMYAFEVLKAELEKIDELNFIFTSPPLWPTRSPTKFARNARSSTYLSSTASAASTAAILKSSFATSSPSGNGQGMCRLDTAQGHVLQQPY